MPVGATLVRSSSETLSWLHRLRDQFPRLEYKESQNWASFRNRRHVVAYLNPNRRSVRLFLPLAPHDAPSLKPSPSSSSWLERFPAVFRIASEHDLSEAMDLIAEAHAAVPTADARPEYVPSEELPAGIEFFEGASRRVLVNAYERNRRARNECLRHRGRSCSVCGFDFEARYGPSAAGYIQVHHVVPIAQVEGEYRVDPVADLRPVCANCHAVIHRKEPPFSLEQVRRMLRDEEGGA